ncbi:MAG: amidase [Gammaproteobacteria bacterium]|nr:MAG: amidase [Gammaproteobacteria bacterium]
MSAYNLRRLRAPRLAGRALKSLVTALDSPLTRRLIEQTLLREAGLPAFRKLDLTESPLMMPRNLEATSGFHSGGLPVSRALEALEASPSKAGLPTILDFVQAYRSGACRPSDVAHRVIERLKALDESGNSPVIAWNPQAIEALARESDARWAAGHPLSLLDGVPVAVKDEIDLVPYTTTVGTNVYGQDGSARDDATVCARLRQAGALFIGKTHMHEIGIGVTGQNAHYRPSRTPWNPQHFTGGSSSGSAAAVALGLCPVALGADGGGSIRIPAALCGLTGLKPTWGRVSEYGAFPLCASVAHIGPMTLTPDDAAIVYSVIAGRDVMDPNTLEQPAPTLSWPKDLGGLKVGLFSPWFSDADPAVVQACHLKAEHMKRLGAEVREVALDDLESVRIAHAITIASEMLMSVYTDFNRRPDAFGPDTRLNLSMARAFSSADYLRAQQVRQRLMDQMNRVFRQVDILITPTTAMTAPPIRESVQPEGESDLRTLSALMRYAFVGNLGGHPALTLPAGLDDQGLPIGLQLMANHWQEDRLLGVARCLWDSAPAVAPSAQSLLNP